MLITGMGRSGAWQGNNGNAITAKAICLGWNGYKQGDLKVQKYAVEDRCAIFPAVYATNLFPRHETWFSIIKQAFDVFFSAAALLVVLPVLALAAIALMIESPGSPIYKQKRIGKDRQIFELWKLRTMFNDRVSDVPWTKDMDPRITPVGHFLRITNIDELPQLWNIIRGDMSIIGPRPLSVKEMNYIEEIRGFSANHPGFYPTVKPGLIGLEQINRARRQMNYGERFELNHIYEQNVGWCMDCTIFLRALLICKQVCLATLAAGAIELLAFCNVLVF